MSLFPRSFQEISPLFRLLDDYEHATRHRAGASSSSSSPFGPVAARTFSPKFDVKELKDAYELHGELPGIAQKDVDIEWTDGNTLTISGRAEHRSERGVAPPKGFIEGEHDDTTTAVAANENHNSNKEHEYRKPTVEDEGAEGKVVTATDANKDVAPKTDDGAKYWVAERAVGEFHRSFSFPTRVDQEAVKASLKHGILSIVVPKAAAPKPRKITVE